MGNERAAMDLSKQFQTAGFEVEQAVRGPEALMVKKHRCKQLLERDSKGIWRQAAPLAFNIRGLDCELEDRGYQKFWRHEDQRFPAHVNDLRALHQFEQEVRSILGIKALYHESLGTRNAQTAYDRLEGRPDQ